MRLLLHMAARFHFNWKFLKKSNFFFVDVLVCVCVSCVSWLWCCCCCVHRFLCVGLSVFPFCGATQIFATIPRATQRRQRQDSRMKLSNFNPLPRSAVNKSSAAATVQNHNNKSRCKCAISCWLLPDAFRPSFLRRRCFCCCCQGVVVKPSLPLRPQITQEKWNEDKLFFFLSPSFLWLDSIKIVRGRHWFPEFFISLKRSWCV